MEHLMKVSFFSPKCYKVLADKDLLGHPVAHLQLYLSVLCPSLSVH